MAFFEKNRLFVKEPKSIEKTELNHKRFNSVSFGCGEGTCFSRASRKTVHRTVFLPTASAQLSVACSYFESLPVSQQKNTVGITTDCIFLAEAKGFEPLWACTQTVFKTASL